MVNKKNYLPRRAQYPKQNAHTPSKGPHYSAIFHSLFSFRAVNRAVHAADDVILILNPVTLMYPVILRGILKNNVCSLLTPLFVLISCLYKLMISPRTLRVLKIFFFFRAGVMTFKLPTKSFNREPLFKITVGII